MSRWSTFAAYTMVNMLLAITGATTLVRVADDERIKMQEMGRLDQFSFFPFRRRFDWKRAIQTGISTSMGLMLLVVGVVRQMDVERHAAHSSYGSHITPLVLFSGLAMGTYIALSESEDDVDDGGDDGDNNSNNGDDDNERFNLVFSAALVLRPGEDDEIGAEPLEHSTNRDNERIVIRNSIMLTIRNVVDSFHSRANIIGNVQANSEVGDDGNAYNDDTDVYQPLLPTTRVEREFIDLPPHGEDSIIAQ